MLLRDFEEIDKYMVNAPYLFKDLSHQKRSMLLSTLTAEQIEFLKSFRLNFDEKDSANVKQKFLRLWRQLPEVVSGLPARTGNKRLGL